MVTIQTVLDKLMENMDPLEHTVDTLKFGSQQTKVTGIVTAFVATQHVLEQAAALGANLVITHEGAFYSHRDRTEIVEHDPVYLEKRRFIEEFGIAIFRFHDYVHRYKPDGITLGLIQTLGWEAYVEEHHAVYTVLTIPALSVKEIAEYVKKQLDISYVRVAGELSMTCTRVGLLAGYRGGGHRAIPLFENENLDLIIYGEGPEWETPEYVRDAVHNGKHKAIIALGHAESEAPGMKYLAERMKTIFPNVPIYFIAEKPCFQVI